MRELTIIIPRLNEEQTIGQVVRDAIRGLRKASCDGVVLVSDNGSTDTSVNIARSQGARVIHFVRCVGTEVLFDMALNLLRVHMSSSVMPMDPMI